MYLTQILGWAGNILFFCGVHALGKKNIIGFYCNGLANLLYAVQSIIMNNPALFWLSMGLIILNISGIVEWSKKEIKMYKIIFEDNTIFEGNSFEGSWNKMPDKLIKRIEYKISDKTLILEGFEQYNHIVKLGFGLFRSIAGVLAIYLLGKDGDKVYRRILSFTSNKMIDDVVRWGEEYNKQPHIGWKKGIISNQKPSIKFI